MTDWKVSLSFQEGNSSKFWRARVEGSTLYVNFGRIGTQGQTQMKEFPNAAGAEKEFAKLEREKRKKGYDEAGAAAAADEDEDEDLDEDTDGDGDEDEDEDEDEAPPAKKKPAAAPAPATPARSFKTEVDGRQIEVTLSLEGADVKTAVRERYPSPTAAKEAFDRVAQGMISEGYRQA